MDDPEEFQSFVHSYSSHVLTVHAKSATPVTKLYLLSHPVPANISAIKFSIVSHDQGSPTTSTEVSSTWFDATILRPIVSAGDDGKSRWPSPSLVVDTMCCSKPSDFAEEFEQQRWKLVDTVPCDGLFRVCVNSMSVHWQTHEIFWNAGSVSDTHKTPGAKFIDTLKEGDRIIIWARATVSLWPLIFPKADCVSIPDALQSPDGMNYVKHARIEVTVAVR